MGLKLVNNGTSVLAGAINTTDTSISLAAGTGARFPTLGAGDWFPLTLVDASGNYEIVRCTARASDILTVTRAQEGTAASAFGAGDRIDLRVTAAAFAQFVLSGHSLDPANNLSDVADAATAIANLGGVPSARTLQGAGLATVAGDQNAHNLSADRIISVPKAAGTDVATGTDDTKALTSKALKDAANTAGGYVRTDGSNKLPALDGSQLTGINTIPVGTTIYVNATSAPAGTLKENGALVSRTTYAALWAFAQASGRVVSEATWSATDWGAFSSGDGSTTFRLPDSRAEFIRGLDDSRGIDSGRNLGSFQNHQFQDHTHSGGAGGGDKSPGGESGASSDNTGNPNSGNHGSETRPRNISKLACIKY